MTDDTATLVGKVFGEWAPELYKAMLASGHKPAAALHLTLCRHLPSRGLFLFFGCEEGRTCGIAGIDPRAVKAVPALDTIVAWATTQTWVEIFSGQVPVAAPTPQRYEH